MAQGLGSLGTAAARRSQVWRHLAQHRSALSQVSQLSQICQLSQVSQLSQIGHGAVALARSGLLGPYRPDHLLAMAQAVRRRGLNLGVVYALGAARGRDRPALVDDEGTMTYADLDDWSDAVAVGLGRAGVGPERPVGVLCRNGRAFLIALVALGKLGADTVHLNTGFAAPQLRQVLAREGVRTVIVEREFLPLVTGRGAGRGGRHPQVVVADGGADDVRSFAAMMSAGWSGPPRRPGRVGRQVVLTSGTTGEPKGAQRDIGADIAPLVSLLSCIPLRSGDTAVIAAPMFHSWGLANTAIGLLLGMRLVTARRFDAEQTLALIERHRARVLVAVPAMLQRIMELPDEVRAGYDLSSVAVVGLSGSAIPGDLATRFMDAYGPVVYNLYGSTEIGWASIASPGDLRAAPSCAGRVPRGTTVRILGADRREVRAGQTGRIFVRGALLFDGYTGGGGKDVVDGFMATGDVGHFDGELLFVDGRDDEMIISGGENVFPREVEDLLSSVPGVAEAAVIGVADDRFGQRLHAFVVLASPSSGLPDEAFLLGEVAAQLARHKVPRAVTFVDHLPRNATGKVLNRQLRDLAVEPPAPRAAPAGRAAGAPRSGGRAADRR